MASVSEASAKQSFPLMRFPPEIVSHILTSYLKSSSVGAGLRLRLVSKYFDAEVIAIIFREHLLKDLEPPYEIIPGELPPEFSGYPTSALIEITARASHPWFARLETSRSQLWHRYIMHHTTNTPNSDYRFARLHKVSQRLCAEVGADFTETVGRLCWISLECGAFTSPCHPLKACETPSADLDLLSAAAYLGHTALVKKLLQSGSLNPSEATDIFDSPMTLAAWGRQAYILLLFQEHQVEHTRRSLSKDETRPGSRRFGWEGKLDPGAVVGAAAGGDLEVLKLAIYPPSRYNPGTTTIFHDHFGSVHGRAKNCILIAKGMARDWKVYQFLAACLGQYDKFLELDYHDTALKQSYSGTQRENRFRRRVCADFLQREHLLRDMERVGLNTEPIAAFYARRLRQIGEMGAPEDPSFVPRPYPAPNEVRDYDEATERNFELRDLELAARNGDIDIVRGLLDDGVGIPSDPPYNPLSEALLHAREDVFDLLSERLAASDPTAVIGNVTPATDAGKCRMVRRLITCGIETKDPLDSIAWGLYLDAAAACDDSAVANFLFEPNVLAKFNVGAVTAEAALWNSRVAGMLGGN
ncbi:hypothetical protein V8F20_003229 [Naviculisporaceae sp. PSN 640]